MSYLDDYGLSQPARKWSLLALSIQDKSSQRDMDILHLMKVVRYFEYLRDTKEIEYSNFKLGVVSFELKQNIETLEESGLIEEQNGKYVLTDEGEKIVEEMEKGFDRKDLQKLVFAKQQLNDLSPDETMYFMYRLIPESQVNSTEFTRLEKKKASLVRCLFLKGRINSNTAAKWLDMSETEFLDFVRDCS